MINTLFSPKGTLESTGFIIAGILLIFVGFALLMAGSVLPIDGRLGMWLSFLLAYPWICIWIKRLRQGGASAALVLAYLALYAVLFLVLFMVSIFFFSGGDFMSLVGEYSRQEITMEEYQAGIQEQMNPTVMIRNLFMSGLIASLATLLIGNSVTAKSVSPT